MNSDLKLFLLVSLLAGSLALHAKARPLISTASGLKSRLKLDEESADCWESLTQLQACTEEIIIFFLNGETQLGSGCCQALSTIGEHCWPNMLDVLGFTLQETQILEGYCDRADDDDGHDDDSTPSSPSTAEANKLF